MFQLLLFPLIHANNLPRPQDYKPFYHITDPNVVLNHEDIWIITRGDFLHKAPELDFFLELEKKYKGIVFLGTVGNWKLFEQEGINLNDLHHAYIFPAGGPVTKRLSNKPFKSEKSMVDGYIFGKVDELNEENIGEWMIESYNNEPARIPMIMTISDDDKVKGIALARTIQHYFKNYFSVGVIYEAYLPKVHKHLGYEPVVPEVFFMIAEHDEDDVVFKAGSLGEGEVKMTFYDISSWLFEVNQQLRDDLINVLDKTGLDKMEHDTFEEMKPDYLREMPDVAKALRNRLDIKQKWVKDEL